MTTETTTKAQVVEAAEAVRKVAGDKPVDIALILGSGLGGLSDLVEDAIAVDYADVPHMAVSTAPGHQGRFLIGTFGGKRVACMQGRLHAYEGYSAAQIAFPVYLLHELGAEKLVVTNAAGGIDPAFEVGDLMLIDDQINFLGMDPCLGSDQPDLHARFFDMTNAYDVEFRKLARVIAVEQGTRLREGVYLAEPGPSFETPAEIRAFAALGADAVGMSTVLEVIAARSIEMRVLGISLISNPAAGVTDTPVDVDDVNRAAAEAAGKLQELVESFVLRV
jgi:purine-nucleoside phosphorylase